MGESIKNVWPLRLAAGLQAGVLAGLIMAGWLMIDGTRRDQTVWTNANLLSTVLVGRQGLRGSFGMQTIAGFALHMMIAGLHGMLFAVLLSPRIRPLWAVNAAVLFSIASYWVSFGWMIGQWAPMLASRASRPAWFGAHVLFGVMLGLYPDFARSLLPKVEEPVAPPPAVEPPPPEGRDGTSPLQEPSPAEAGSSKAISTADDTAG